MTFTDGNDVKAKVMGVDEDKDLAVLLIDPAKLGAEVMISQMACTHTSHIG